MRQTSEFITGQISKEEIKRIVSDNFWYVAETPSVFQTGYCFQIGFGSLTPHFPKIYNTTLLICSRGYFWFYASEKDSLGVGKMLYEGFSDDEKFIFTKKEDWKADLKPFYKNASQVFYSGLSKLSNPKLAKIYQEFMASFYKAWTIPLILEMNTVYVEQEIVPRLKKQLGLPEGDFNEMFAILSQPSTLSFLTNERADLLKLALNFSDARLKAHYKKYYWIKTSYRRIRNYSEAEIKKLVEGELTKGRDFIKGELKEIEETPENIVKKRRDLIEKYKISPEDQNKFEMMRILGDWQDKRKEMNIFGNHHIFLMLVEVAKRLDLALDLVSHAFPSEIIDVLEGNTKLSKKTLQDRYDFIFHAVNGQLEEIVITGKEARNLKKIIDEKIEERFQEIKGMTASVGKISLVKGKVRVVLNPSGVDIPKGSILVAPMTRPDFVHLIKKAEAIVTDQGGVTSHAAIVSRELGIPCIVGTGLATKLLKDGDTVEVDTRTGVVTKI